MAPEPTALVPSTDGVTVALHDLGGDGPVLLVAHATGFCAGPYRPLATELADRFRVVGVDLRGHGDTAASATRGQHWDGVTDDVLAAVDHLGGPVYGFGHSMGGAVLIGAELRQPGSLRALVVFEPIIVPAGMDNLERPNFMADNARRRRPGFPSRPAALDRYAGRPPLGLFRADVLHAYVDQGFADQADGGIALKCTPEVEAATFEGDGKLTTDQVAGVDLPILVGAGAREVEGPARMAPPLADALPQGELRTYPHLTHFGPFQDPVTIAADAKAFLTGP